VTENEQPAWPSATPLVTVITPAYNRADLVAETIESVLSQDYPSLEYVVLDDGSRDTTLDVVKRYGDRLRWESHANVGEARTVNRGFAMARGDIVGVVNSDDPLRPGAVRRLVEALQRRPDAVVAYPDWEMIDEHGGRLRTVRTYEFTSYADMVRRHYCLPGPAAFFRRSLVERIGGRDPELRYTGDLDFWFRAGRHGAFVRVPEVLATFRTHSGSATVVQQGTRMAEEHLRLTEKLFADPALPEELRRVEREARSSAAFVAGTVCGRGAWRARLGYFASALRLAPAKYLGEYAVRWPLIVATLLNVPYLDVYYRLKAVEERLLGRRATAERPPPAR
jgi:glycosyltransferase involved in cell wall biosynthesis